MAIIKCPECGHQVSEKAPSCPGCGVPIYGKIVKCPDCGEVYFDDQVMCPACHRPTEKKQSAPVQSPVQVQFQQQTNAETTVKQETQPQEPKKKSYTALIISLVFAAVVCGVCYYYYNDAKMQKERESYEYAMSSTDPMVLQLYLDTYKDTNTEHRDSIQSRLSKLHEVETEWNNAVKSGTRDAIETYLKNHPDTPYKGLALNKIDSMDFVVAQKANTLEAYNAYLDKHADGKYADQAKNELDAIKSSQVLPEETQMIKGLFKRFFQSVNSRNEDGMLATVADQLISFLGNTSAGKSDVLMFLQKLYKSDITNMNWHILDDYQIEKKQTGQGEYEFTVTFTAEQNIERTDASQPKYKKYVIEAAVNTEGKISKFNMKQ